MEEVIVQLITKYPVVAAIFVAIGVFRTIFKPIMTVVDLFVASTPSKKDDAVVAGFKSGKIYKALVWFVDYTTSIKLPVAKTDDSKA